MLLSQVGTLSINSYLQSAKEKRDISPYERTLLMDNPTWHSSHICKKLESNEVIHQDMTHRAHVVTRCVLLMALC